MKRNNEKVLGRITTGYGFWMVNKYLTRHLQSLQAAALLADLISKRELFISKGWLDSSGGFYSMAVNIEKDLLFTKEYRIKMMKKLIDAGFLTVVKKGMPQKNYYYINDSAILDAIGKAEEIEIAENDEEKANFEDER